MMKINLQHGIKLLQQKINQHPRAIPFTGSILLLLLGLYLLPVILFVELADEIMEGELYVDRVVMGWVKILHTPELTLLFKVFTEAGGVLGVGFMTILAIITYWLKGYKKAWLMVSASVLGALVINLSLKGIFQRDRPDFWTHFVQEAGYSFPSGHAMASAALAISLIVLMWRTRARWWVLAGGTFYTFMVGLSRVYLGVHYPTDIVAGWCVSFLWVGVVTLVVYEYSVFKNYSASR